MKKTSVIRGLLLSCLLINSKKIFWCISKFCRDLEAFIYSWESFYARADFAFSYVKETFDHMTTFTGIQTDDLLFTSGYNFKQEHGRVTLSGLFGVPTHDIVALRHVPFGSVKLAWAFKLMVLLILKVNERFSMARVIFILSLAMQRMILIINIIYYWANRDLLAAYKKNWPVHGIEFGYTARFFFAASVQPPFDDEVKKLNYIRSNFYTVYKYRFYIHEHPQRLLLNVSYGFDHTPKHFGNKYIVTIWGSWNISF